MPASRIEIEWQQYPNIFNGNIDHFSGITVDLNDQTMESYHESECFEKILRESLEHYQEFRLRAIWLKIPVHHAHLVSLASQKFQFDLHHCRDDFIMMSKWLAYDEAYKLPPYCTASIGCGAIVYDEENQKVLMVLEKFIYHEFKEKEKHKHFKIPTGTLDVGEDIRECVVREVKEEVGIDTEVVTLLGFRELHNFRFETDDFHFCFLLRPLSTEIRIDPEELAEAFWVPVDEFLKMEELSNFNTTIQQAFRKYLDNPKGRCIVPQNCTNMNSKSHGTWYEVADEQSISSNNKE